jgi:hypothetical protein
MRVALHVYEISLLRYITSICSTSSLSFIHVTAEVRVCVFIKNILQAPDVLGSSAHFKIEMTLSYVSLRWNWNSSIGNRISNTKKQHETPPMAPAAIVLGMFE